MPTAKEIVDELLNTTLQHPTTGQAVKIADLFRYSVPEALLSSRLAHPTKPNTQVTVADFLRYSAPETLVGHPLPRPAGDPNGAGANVSVGDWIRFMDVRQQKILDAIADLKASRG